MIGIDKAGSKAMLMQAGIFPKKNYFYRIDHDMTF